MSRNNTNDQSRSMRELLEIYKYMNKLVYKNIVKPRIFKKLDLLLLIRTPSTALHASVNVITFVSPPVSTFFVCQYIYYFNFWTITFSVF